MKLRSRQIWLLFGGGLSRRRIAWRRAVGRGARRRRAGPQQARRRRPLPVLVGGDGLDVVVHGPTEDGAHALQDAWSRAGSDQEGFADQPVAQRRDRPASGLRDRGRPRTKLGKPARTVRRAGRSCGELPEIGGRRPAHLADGSPARKAQRRWVRSGEPFSGELITASSPCPLGSSPATPVPSSPFRRQH